ncbi:MAG: rhodanese-like domain-containing protein [Flavobacteriales bacterium]|nr:rhodanese-like domain-containing protein [Flavobacteriales bacterium]MBK6754235.1 rhodanese-like domain-containing protein [Flavobacteriales bacterium]MBK7271570.1 rhodanese-like domain-containing protein [Flavobacteriales bacterium]MBK7754604.1 rhodanese-like domain-containing protein [Flavobacteriales bacterium]MBK9074620.1 rhodanese-like domain-containing protein [Flavobacteriales bacterium]
MGLRRELLGEPSAEDIARLVKEGATILDIRSQEEYETGHIPGCLHIPIGELLRSLPMIPRGRPVVTCNADDALSATAAEILGAHGFQAYDGGGWTTLSKLVEKE